MTRQVTVIGPVQIEISGWCPECTEQIRMVTLAEAVKMAGVSNRAIYRWVESGQIHFSAIPGGLLLICLESLFRLTGMPEHTGADSSKP